MRVRIRALLIDLNERTNSKEIQEEVATEFGEQIQMGGDGMGRERE